MDFTWLQLLIAFLGSSGIIGGGYTVFTLVYTEINKRKAAKAERDEKNRDKAYEAVWKLYEDAKAQNEKLQKEIDDLEKGHSLSRPTVSKIYQAVRKLGRQMEIIDSIFIKEFSLLPDQGECKLACDALKKEMDILWQKYDELEKCLP